MGIALGATWDPSLVEEVGRALAGEARSKGARVLLAPTVNLHRSPLNGRNFECYAEDPYLTARLACAYIVGLQGAGVAATIALDLRALAYYDDREGRWVAEAGELRSWSGARRTASVPAQRSAWRRPSCSPRSAAL